MPRKLKIRRKSITLQSHHINSSTIMSTGTKAKRGRLAVPAFYSLIGFIMAVSLQSTCQFVVRKLVLSYTKRPTFAPTMSPSAIPSAAPTVFVPPTFPAVNSTQNATAQASDVSEVDGAGTNTVENDVGTERHRNRQLQNNEKPRKRGPFSDHVAQFMVDVMTRVNFRKLFDIRRWNTSNQKTTHRQLQSNVTTAAPTIAPTPIATTSQPTLFDNITKEILEERIVHRVGLWDWEVQDGVCVPYTVCIQTRACFSPAFDSQFNTARTFAVISSMVGGVVTMVILASLCFPFNPIYLTPVYVLLMMFQGLSLMVYRSGICDHLSDAQFWLAAGGEQIDPNTGELSEEAQLFERYLSDNTEVTCTHGAGSKMAISAVIMWFLAAITCYWNVKRQRDL